MTGPADGTGADLRAAAGEPVPETFSTVGLPVPDRVERWERHNASALVRLEVRSAAPLEAAETSVRLPGLTLARVRGSAHAVDRSAAAIARDPYDAFAVYLPVRGEGTFRQGEDSLLLRPGQAVVCETDRPFARGFVYGLDELVVKAPRAGLEVPGGTCVLRSPRVADAGDPYAAALARLTARATRVAHPVRVDAHTVLELVTVLAAGPRAARAAAYRAAARSFIDEHLTEPGLGADQVAAAIGVSERHLSRIFAADGASVPRYVLARRLELAHTLLDAPAGPSARRAGTVAEIAAACGFISVTYFSHVFRREFGRRAGEVLREARARSDFRHAGRAAGPDGVVGGENHPTTLG